MNITKLTTKDAHLGGTILQAGQRELTSFPGTYVDDIKLIHCVEKKRW